MGPAATQRLLGPHRLFGPDISVDWPDSRSPTSRWPVRPRRRSEPPGGTGSTCYFQYTVADSVPAGATVTGVNEDSQAHTVMSKGRFDVDIAFRGDGRVHRTRHAAGAGRTHPGHSLLPLP